MRKSSIGFKQDFRFRMVKHAGVDSLKVQVYKPETITLNSSRKDFKLGKKRLGRLFNPL